ncbi:PREDICTED: uncharacterized protein LOC109228151 [Nicotiana attenuata]|uniref:uncharacterized protein LOC109228151 n=1 Tax=Nicotiana attenuata TaxID=49451 RepID=UPI000904A4B8|nr:PREDICTED: uncharacterized protein LOC109228151 [Nicotiana attenuata]
MKKVLIEVPDSENLLKKSGHDAVWLKPLPALLERKKLEGHSSLTLMNDIIHSSLKINLIGTELMRRISRTNLQVIELYTEAHNWKEQFEGLRLEKDVLAEEKGSLEQQLRLISAELVILKASSD